MPNTYNYAALDSALAAEAKKAATDIKNLIESVENAAVKIGNDLIIIKDGLGHGEFGKWIEAEFGMSDRTAQIYMTIARDPESEIISVLGTALAAKVTAPSTPPKAREEIVARIKAGEKPRAAEVKETIGRWKPKVEAAPEVAPDGVDALLDELAVGDEADADDVETEASAEETEARARAEAPVMTKASASKAPAKLKPATSDKEDRERAAREAAEILLFLLKSPDDLTELVGLLERADLKRIVEHLKAGAPAKKIGGAAGMFGKPEEMVH